MKLARTIADLAGCEKIGSVHLAEAQRAEVSNGIEEVILFGEPNISEEPI